MTEPVNIIHITSPRDITLKFDGYDIFISTGNTTPIYLHLMNLDNEFYVFKEFSINRSEILEAFAQYRINQYLEKEKAKAKVSVYEYVGTSVLVRSP